MVHKCFLKKSAGSSVSIHADESVFNSEGPLDLATQKLAEELHKPIIRKFKKEKIIADPETIFGVLIWQVCS